MRHSIGSVLALAFLCHSPVLAFARQDAKPPVVVPALPAPRQAPASASVYPTAAPPMAPGPFTIQSADGLSRLKVGGMIQAQFRGFTDDGRTGNSGFLLRRVRPILDGTLYGWIDFRLMPEFGEGRSVLQDAYLDLHLRPTLVLRAGKFKVPYSLERLQAATDVPFVERSLANNLIPIRDVGVMLMSGPDNGFEWELSLSNGTLDNTSSDSNGDNALDVTGRVFYRPFMTTPRSPWRGLGFGLAANTGSSTEPLTAEALRTAGRSAFFRYADGTLGNGTRTRFAPQFFLYTRSWGFMGEYLETRQKIHKAAVATTDKNTGFMLQTTYVLTGESTSFRNVVPRAPFEPTKGGGAYELAFRYSEVRTNEDTFRAGLSDASVSAETAKATTIGLNWYATRQLKVKLNYEHTDFGRTLRFTSGDRKQEDVVLGEMQLNF